MICGDRNGYTKTIRTISNKEIPSSLMGIIFVKQTEIFKTQLNCTQMLQSFSIIICADHFYLGHFLHLRDNLSKKLSNHTTAAGYFALRGQQRIKTQPLEWSIIVLASHDY